MLELIVLTDVRYSLGKGVNLIPKTVTVIERGLRVEQHRVSIITNPELKTRDVETNSSLSQSIAHSFLTEVIR